MFTTINTNQGYIILISKNKNHCNIEIKYKDKQREDSIVDIARFSLLESETLDLIETLEFHCPREIEEDLD